MSTAFPVLLSTSQVAARLGVHRDTVHEWIVRGTRTPHGRLKLPALLVGTRYRVTETALLEWLRSINPETHVEMARQDAAREKRARAALKELGWE